VTEWGEITRAETRRETTAEIARRILNEELDKLGWKTPELANARKIRIAQHCGQRPH